MSDYRRLISYLYVYEGGVKGANTGYAKIEVRNGQCRIYVNVRRVYLGGNDIGVYLLTGDGEVRIGKIFIRGGNGEFRTTLNAQDIDGTGRRMEMCHGLTIHDIENSWKSYTTIWEDAVTHAAEIDLAEVTSANARRKEAVQGNAVREKAAGERAVQKGIPEEKTIEERTIEERPIRGQIRQEKAITEKSGVPGNIEKGSDVPDQAEKRVSETDRKRATETDKTEKQEKTVSPERFPISAQIESDLRREEEALKDIAPWDEDPAAVRSSVPKPDAENPVKEETAFAAGQPTAREAPAIRSQESRLWNRMQREYAKVLAFDYDKGCEILSIKPQDIGLLPRDIWIYGNNSFLLHGYYHYRHLILARLEDLPGEPRYLLGVPGRCYSNERNMAAMFGFPYFVSARKQPDADGKFGYWYTIIHL
ncbi:MAG: hypothetical protein LUD07_06340 [Clostridiales bacterium]|nr:hypothetical protein [Clostridiales bacterium]